MIALERVWSYEVNDRLARAQCRTIIGAQRTGGPPSIRSREMAAGCVSLRDGMTGKFISGGGGISQRLSRFRTRLRSLTCAAQNSAKMIPIRSC